MLMGQKYRVHRSVIIGRVRRECGVDLSSPASEVGIVEAIEVLDRIKAEGLGAASDSTA
jgi:hypothetical protein